MGGKLSRTRYHRIKTMAMFIALVTFQLPYKKCVMGQTGERNQSDIVREFFVSNLPNVCPKLGTCLNRPEGVNSDSVGGNSCCQCSCNDYCHTFNNCCLDKEDTPANTETIQPWQIECFTHSPDIQNGTHMPLLSYHYWMVSKCARQYKNDTLKGKCENPSLFILEESLPVVFADDGEIIFRNKFCAICNKYYRWTEWNVIYSINQDYLQQTNLGMEVNIDMYIGIVSGDKTFSGWNAFFFPPIDKPSFSFRCYQHIEILDCNVTGAWQKYDWLIDKACSHTRMPYLNYNNPYCAVCNKNFFRSDCTILEEWNYGRGFMHFSYLINYKDTEGEINKVCLEGDVRNCGASLIFDYHQQRCRPIYCSKFQVQTSKGKCIDRMYKMISGTIDILLHITGPLDPVLTSAEKMSLAQKYFTTFIKPIKHLNAYPPNLMSVDTMPFPNSNTVLVITIRVFVTPADFQTDPIALLYERVKKLSEFSYYSDGKHYDYNVYFASQFEWDPKTKQVNDMERNAGLLNIFRSGANTFGGNWLRKQLFCPQIRLQAKEVQDFVFRIVILSTNKTLYEKEFQKVRPNKTESYEYIICVDDYLPVIPCGNGGTEVLRPTALRQIIMIMSVSYIYI